MKVVDDGDRGEDGVMTAVVKTDVPPLVRGGAWCGMSLIWTVAAELPTNEFTALMMDTRDAVERVTDIAARRRQRIPGSKHAQMKRRTGGGHRA